MKKILILLGIIGLLAGCKSIPADHPTEKEIHDRKLEEIQRERGINITVYESSR